MAEHPSERWLTDTNKILLTQILTVILTPVSIALTLYLIQYSRAPKADIRYVGASPEYTVVEPPASLASAINNDPGLASEFRDQIRQAILGKDNLGSCSAWLDEGSWDSDCLPVYKSVSNQLRGVLEGVIAQGHDSIQESRAKGSMKIIEELRKELTLIENTNSPRAGNVALTAGVLNTADSDGTVFADGLLSFNNQVMHVNADGYTTISAHGFSEITFTTPREDAGKFLGSFTEGEEPVIKAWSDLVKSGNEIPFELTITFSGKNAKIKGAVPKEE